MESDANTHDEEEWLPHQNELGSADGRPARTAAEYEATAILNRLERARIAREMTKAEVARSVEKHPAAIRRLLTSENFNPELLTLIQLADSVGLKVTLERVRRPYRQRVVGN